MQVQGYPPEAKPGAELHQYVVRNRGDDLHLLKPGKIILPSRARLREGRVRRARPR